MDRLIYFLKLVDAHSGRAGDTFSVLFAVAQCSRFSPNLFLDFGVISNMVGRALPSFCIDYLTLNLIPKASAIRSFFKYLIFSSSPSILDNTPYCKPVPDSLVQTGYNYGE